ncbi:MAG: HAD hydrolase family protein [Sulfuricurvum sp.]|nr:HAD hydrolase family protein [Sulfuricurvum sp.]MDP3021765.1 HAD hydrolase family protein [Sulfuricurvum sp.]
MIRLILLDVDGCMTDGHIIYNEKGEETKNFNVKDGFIIRSWLRMGHQVAIITGRESAIVTLRAKELHIPYVFQGVDNKLEVTQKLCEELGLQSHEVAAIGDDLNDYNMLQWVGQGYTPKNGTHYLHTVATVLEKNGGDAVVREMIEKVIDNNGEREKFLSLWI